MNWEDRQIALETSNFVVIGRATKHFTTLEDAVEFAKNNEPCVIYERIGSTQKNVVVNFEGTGHGW